MKKLRSVKKIPSANGKGVAHLRMDLDVPKNDDNRIINSIETIEELFNKGYKVVITGHKGRPKGIGYEEEFTLLPVYFRLKKILENKLGRKINSILIDDITDERKVKNAIDQYEIVFTENIRFYKGERKGDTSHLNVLKKYCNISVFDAVAVAHRNEGSVIFNRKKTYYGFNFIKEYQLMKTLNKRTGRLVILGGTKKDKLDNLIQIAKESWKVFIGGKLSIYRQEIEEKIIQEIGEIPDNIIWAQLTPDGYDLSNDSIAVLKNLIKISKTVVWCGALGWFEKGYNKGTIEIATTLIESNAYIAIGGGDTAASIINLGGKYKIDFLCSAGGALLFSLANGPENLPAVA